MAVRGTQAKADITQKILETFSGSFVHEKEIRIPYVEDGVGGEIKVTLTAAKVAVGNNANSVKTEESAETTFVKNEQVPQEPTEEEKERLKMLLEKLGI